MARFKLDVANLKEKHFLSFMEKVNDLAMSRPYNTTSSIKVVEPTNAQQFYTNDDLASISSNIFDDLVKEGLAWHSITAIRDTITKHLVKEFSND
jgi:hypothetical protein